MEIKFFKIKYTTNNLIGGEVPPCGPLPPVLEDCINRDENGKVQDAIDHTEFITVFDDPYKLPSGHCFKKDTICQWRNTRIAEGKAVTNPLTGIDIPLQYVNDCLSNCDK